MTTTTTGLPYATILRACRRSGPPVDTVVEFVRERRKEPGESEALDEFFVSELRQQDASLAQLCEVQARLHEKHRELTEALATLTAPPLHEGILITLEKSPDRCLATVAHGGTRRIVGVHPHLPVDRLLPGVVVLLNSELSAIVSQPAEPRTASGEIAVVVRRIAPHRLVIRDRDTEIVVNEATNLHGVNLKADDHVVWNRDVMLALEPVAGAERSAAFINIQDLTGHELQRLGGVDQEVARIIGLFTQSFLLPELAGLYGVDGHNKSLLMVGPAGCGKTSLARRAAQEVALAMGQQCRFATVNGTELESPWVGETQRIIRELFRELNDHEGPAILYIDEVESVGRHRGHVGGQHSDKFLSQWLTCLDGFSRRANVAVIASTNRKDLIDAALLERISGTEIAIGRPTMSAARDIFAIHLPESIPYRANGASVTETREHVIQHAVARLYDPNATTELATVRFRDGKSRTVTVRELASGRLFEQICVNARQRAFERHARGDEPGLTTGDIEHAVMEAVDKLASTLTRASVPNLIADLPQDVDVVAVEPMRRRGHTHRYLVPADD
jgi:ATPase family associated with various cellular activities (AAA)/Proteasomal ATPase OB N-terminal domain